MQNDTPKAEPEARWEKIPMPATEEEQDLETMLKIMERVELAYPDGEREPIRLN